MNSNTNSNKGDSHSSTDVNQPVYFLASCQPGSHVVEALVDPMLLHSSSTEHFTNYQDISFQENDQLLEVRPLSFEVSENHNNWISEDFNGLEIAHESHVTQQQKEDLFEGSVSYAFSIETVNSNDQFSTFTDNNNVSPEFVTQCSGTNVQSDGFRVVKNEYAWIAIGWFDTTFWERLERAEINALKSSGISKKKEKHLEILNNLQTWFLPFLKDIMSQKYVMEKLKYLQNEFRQMVPEELKEIDSVKQLVPIFKVDPHHGLMFYVKTVVGFDEDFDSSTEFSKLSFLQRIPELTKRFAAKRQEEVRAEMNDRSKKQIKSEKRELRLRQRGIIKEFWEKADFIRTKGIEEKNEHVAKNSSHKRDRNSWILLKTCLTDYFELAYLASNISDDLIQLVSMDFPTYDRNIAEDKRCMTQKYLRKILNWDLGLDGSTSEKKKSRKPTAGELASLFSLIWNTLDISVKKGFQKFGVHVEKRVHKTAYPAYRYNPHDEHKAKYGTKLKPREKKK